MRIAQDQKSAGREDTAPRRGSRCAGFTGLADRQSCRTSTMKSYRLSRKSRLESFLRAKLCESRSRKRSIAPGSR